MNVPSLSAGTFVHGEVPGRIMQSVFRWLDGYDGAGTPAPAPALAAAEPEQEKRERQVKVGDGAQSPLATVPVLKNTLDPGNSACEAKC